MVKVLKLGLMVTPILETLRITKDTDMVNIFVLEETVIRDNGLKTKEMDEDKSNTQMMTNLLENFKMKIDMVRGHYTVN
jgi:hypothetical protein